MGARCRWRILAPTFALLLISPNARADGHRAEAAAAYSMLRRAGSTVGGLGYSAAIPLCWVTPDNDCDRNKFSFVAAWGDLSHTPDDDSNAPTVELKYRLVGVRRSHGLAWPDQYGDDRLSGFVTVLGGGILRRESPTSERSGRFGSGGAGVLTVGAELVVFRQGPLGATAEPNVHLDPVFDVRVRAQYAFSAYRVGDNGRWGHGPTFTVSIGWEID
jgi:hypothetical protein